MPLECHCGGKKLSRLQKDTKHKNIAKNIKLFIIFKSHIRIEIFSSENFCILNTKKSYLVLDKST